MESSEFEYANFKVAENQSNETLTMRINDGEQRVSFEELVTRVGFDLSDLSEFD